MLARHPRVNMREGRGNGRSKRKAKAMCVKSRRGNEGKVGRKSPLYDTLRIVSGFSTFCTIWQQQQSVTHTTRPFSPSAFVTRVPLPAASWLLVGTIAPYHKKPPWQGPRKGLSKLHFLAPSECCDGMGGGLTYILSVYFVR